MKVNIWHGCDINDGEFFPISVKAMLGEPADMYIFAYSYQHDPDEEHANVLDNIWRENNVVDGDEIPVRHGSRSLSVGDVVHVEGLLTARVESVGWTVLDETQLVEFLERQR